MQQLRIPKNIQEILIQYLNTRHCFEVGHSQGAGIPQGCTLGTFLFCCAINGALCEIAKLQLDFIAYVDDILINLGNVQKKAEILPRVTKILKQFGFKINEDKCQSSEDCESIEFTGIKLSH